MRLLDLFCGRWGWSRAFAARGWECVGVDLVESSEIPIGCRFIKADVLSLCLESHETQYGEGFLRFIENDKPCAMPFDFIVASPPCEEFSVHGMRHFHPHPKYPEMGIKLFNHTRSLCEASGVPYVIENVRAAQQFVGQGVHHCGPFYLWGNGVPPLVWQGIHKGLNLRNASGKYTSQYAKSVGGKHSSSSDTVKIATIPPELANCVCDYAERLLEQRRERAAQPTGSAKD